MEYSIRVAEERDLDGLCTIRNNMDLFIWYLKQYDKQEAYLVIAEQNNRNLGFGVLKLKGDFLPKLSNLYVNKTNRGKGIGSALSKISRGNCTDSGCLLK